MSSNEISAELIEEIKKLMHEEDRKIHELLEDLVIQCQEMSHHHFGDLLENCDQIECVARLIHEDD